MKSMANDGSKARAYHEATNHSLQSVRSNQHQLIWNNQPRPFKLYADAETVSLGEIAPDSTMHALDAIASTGSPDAPGRALTTPILAALLHYSAGITKRIQYGQHVMEFRAAACTGALYHIDVYAVTAPLDGLKAGVYQYGPQDGALRSLRAGDYRSALIDACEGDETVRQAEALLVLTTTFWRNAWKYQARAYRHAYWDSGTMLANTLAVANAHNLRTRVVLSFLDDTVNQLFDLDTEREVSVAIVALGQASAEPPPSPPLEPLSLRTIPYSAYEVPEPLIVETHRASSLRDGQTVAVWRERSAELAAPTQAPENPPQLSGEGTAEPIESIIRKRGSARRFQRTPISLDDLDAIIYASTRGIPSDVLGASGPTTSSLYLIVNAVTGMEPGAYAYVPATHTLETLRTGDFRTDAGFLDLGQELAADAALNVYVLSDLDRVLGALGDRGYRAAQLEASVISGKLYLASYARDLAATGLTFFDDEVVRFFGPHAAGKSVMFLTAIGHRAQRMRIG
jgi:SagB-type dehydrogenase family enzyme